MPHERSHRTGQGQRAEAQRPAALAEDARAHRGFQITHQARGPLNTQVFPKHHELSAFTTCKVEIHIGLTWVIQQHLLEFRNVVQCAVLGAQS